MSQTSTSPAIATTEPDFSQVLADSPPASPTPIKKAPAKKTKKNVVRYNTKGKKDTAKSKSAPAPAPAPEPAVVETIVELPCFNSTESWIEYCLGDDDRTDDDLANSWKADDEKLIKQDKGVAGAKLNNNLVSIGARHNEVVMTKAKMQNRVATEMTPREIDLANILMTDGVKDGGRQQKSWKSIEIKLPIPFLKALKARDGLDYHEATYYEVIQNYFHQQIGFINDRYYRMEDKKAEMTLTTEDWEQLLEGTFDRDNTRRQMEINDKQRTSKSKKAQGKARTKEQKEKDNLIEGMTADELRELLALKAQMGK